MKKMVIVLLTAVFSMAFAATSFADSDDIWADFEQNAAQETELAVDIVTNGKATDGLLTLTYDPAVLSCTEQDVAAASGVDMYSANVTEPGTLKISWLGSEAVPQGTLFTVTFTAVSEEADGKIKLEGEAYTAEGEALTVGMASEEETEKETEAPAKPQDPVNPGSGNNGSAGPDNTSGSETGDSANLTGVLVLFCIGVLGCAVAARKVRVNR